MLEQQHTHTFIVNDVECHTNVDTLSYKDFYYKYIKKFHNKLKRKDRKINSVLITYNYDDDGEDTVYQCKYLKEETEEFLNVKDIKKVIIGNWNDLMPI